MGFNKEIFQNKTNTKFTCITYEKESILGNIGIKRWVYSIITKGNLDQKVHYISGFLISGDDQKAYTASAKSLLKQFIKTHSNDIVAVEYGDIKNMNGKESEEYAIFYEKLLKSLGFVNITMSPKMDGYMTTNSMIYKNDNSMKVIDEMIHNGLILSFSK